MTKPSHVDLSRRERQIVDILYREGRATAAEVQAALPDPPSYSAVRAMLARLEAKGHLRHQEDGPRYIYSATTSPATAKRAALRNYLEVFFGGSRGRLVTALLQEESWSDEDLDELERAIEQARRERRKESATAAPPRPVRQP